MSKTYGIKFIKEGANIDSTNPADFTINSKYNTLKTATTGRGSVIINSGTPLRTVAINHNLGYKPLINLYYRHPENLRWHLAPSICDRLNYTGINFGLACGYQHTNSNLITVSIYFHGFPLPAASQTILYKYRVFIDPNEGAWF